MSTRPNPVALTACILLERSYVEYDAGIGPMSNPITCRSAANLASRLHRLSRGAMRASVAECNGEMLDRQREKCQRWMDELKANPRDMRYVFNDKYHQSLEDVDRDVAEYANRIDRAISKLNADLAPLAIEAHRNGDPRGYAIKLRSTDPTRHLPSNEMGGEWGI